jgi:hypothetical protein
MDSPSSFGVSLEGPDEGVDIGVELLDSLPRRGRVEVDVGGVGL